jgi:hypothetical protein
VSVATKQASAHDVKESDRNATSLAISVQSTEGVIVGVVLAKTVFALCVADPSCASQIDRSMALALARESRYDEAAVCLDSMLKP